MNVISKIVSEKAVMLLVLVIFSGLVFVGEVMEFTLSQTATALVFTVFGYFFGQSTPQQIDNVEQLG